VPTPISICSKDSFISFVKFTPTNAVIGSIILHSVEIKRAAFEGVGKE
jgi:hypothetical protein